MDLKEFKEKYPNIYQAAFEEGKKEGVTESTQEAEAQGFEKGKLAGLSEGAENERKRIKDVEAQLIPGHEELIKELKFDGKTSGPEAAVQVLQAENLVRETVKEQLKADSPEPVTAAIAPEVDEEGKKVTEEDLPFEEKAKAKWDAHSDLRKEYDGDYETYLAAERALSGGHVKVIGDLEEK